MKAELLRRERVQLPSGAFVDMVVWCVPQPLTGSAHGYKYRLAYVVDGRCVLVFVPVFQPNEADARAVVSALRGCL